MSLSFPLISKYPRELRELYLLSPIIFSENLIFRKLLSMLIGMKDSQLLSGRFIRYFCTPLSEDKNKDPATLFCIKSIWPLIKLFLLKLISEFIVKKSDEPSSALDE